MNPLSAIMGLADITCISLVLYTFGFVWWTIVLTVIMVSKGAMSFL